MNFNPAFRMIGLSALAIGLAACSDQSAKTAASGPASAPVETAPRSMSVAAPEAKPSAEPAKAPMRVASAASSATTSEANLSPEEAAWAALAKAGDMPEYFKSGDQPTRDQIMEAMGKERDRLGKSLDAIQDFQKQYPKSSHRNDSIKMLVETATNLESMSPDGSERAKTALQSVKDMTDLSVETAFRLTVHDFSDEIQKTTDTAKMPAVVARVEAGTEAFAKKYPGTDESRQLYMGIANALPQLAPDRVKPFFEKLTKSDDAEMRSFAETKLRYLNLLGGSPEIHFTAIDGKEIDLAKLKGKVVMVDFWATWCGPCVAALPEVIETYKKYHDQGFEIIGISLDDNRSALDNFIKDRGMTWPEYYDGKRWKNEIAARYGVEAIPAQWLVDKEGKVVELDARQGDNLSDKVAALLAGKKID